MNQSINQSISTEMSHEVYPFYNQGASWYDHSSNNSVFYSNWSSPSILTSSPQPSYPSYTYTSPENSYYYPYYTNYFQHSTYYDNCYSSSSNFSSSDCSQKIESPINYSSENDNLKVRSFDNNLFFTPEKPKSEKRSKIQRKQLLPDNAVDIMNEWFDDHFNNPYPTLEEKERMAKQGGITVKQVTAWFSNRRNRSQNTKPKRIRRAIEQEMHTMIDQLSYNPNQVEIIQKLKTLF